VTTPGGSTIAPLSITANLTIAVVATNLAEITSSSGRITRRETSVNGSWSIPQATTPAAVNCSGNGPVTLFATQSASIPGTGTETVIDGGTTVTSIPGNATVEIDPSNPNVLYFNSLANTGRARDDPADGGLGFEEAIAVAGQRNLAVADINKNNAALLYLRVTLPGGFVTNPRVAQLGSIRITGDFLRPSGIGSASVRADARTGLDTPRPPTTLTITAPTVTAVRCCPGVISIASTVRLVDSWTKALSPSGQWKSQTDATVTITGTIRVEGFTGCVADGLTGPGNCGGALTDAGGSGCAGCGDGSDLGAEL